MKRLLFALCAVLLASSAFAGVKDVTFTTSSLADDAIDTLVVDISDALWLIDNNEPTLHFSLANMEQGAADSCAIGVDIGASYPNLAGAGSSGDGAWTIIYTGLVTTATDDIDPKTVVNLEAATFEGADMRLRIQNVSGSAEAITVRLSYLVAD